MKKKQPLAASPHFFLRETCNMVITRSWCHVLIQLKKDKNSLWRCSLWKITLNCTFLKTFFHLPHYLINQLQRVDYKVILLYTPYKWILLIEKGCKSVLKDCLG